MKKLIRVSSLIMLFGIIAVASYFAVVSAVGKDVKDSVEKQEESKTTEVETNVTNHIEKSDSQGEVTINVTPLLESEKERLAFEVEMNTHSVDLLQYELDKVAKVSFGQRQNVSNFTWETISADSHHTKGVLTMEGKWDSDVSFIELKLENINSVPLRSFKWLRGDLSE